MKGIFNGELIKDTLPVALNDRALQFGDGIFETIALHNKKHALLPFHHARLLKGAKALHLNLPHELSSINDLSKMLIKFAVKNFRESHVRLKIMVWRKNELQKGYTSHDQGCNYLITGAEISKPDIGLITCGISKNVQNHKWLLSPYKKMNALPYITASHERDNSKFEDLIILDNAGHVSECIYSNIFWKVGNQLYTPHLDTGCVAGVMREYIINLYQKSSHPVLKVKYKPEQVIEESEMIFTTNALGANVINSVNGQHIRGMDLNKIKKEVTQLLPPSFKA